MDVEALREQTPGCLHRVHLICAEAFASDSFTVLRPLEHLYVDCASVLPPMAGTLTEAWPPALQAMFTASRAPARTRSATPCPRLARSGGAGPSQWRLR